MSIETSFEGYLKAKEGGHTLPDNSMQVESTMDTAGERTASSKAASPTPSTTPSPKRIYWGNDGTVNLTELFAPPSYCYACDSYEEVWWGCLVCWPVGYSVSCLVVSLFGYSIHSLVGASRSLCKHSLITNASGAPDPNANANRSSARLRRPTSGYSSTCRYWCWR